VSSPYHVLLAHIMASGESSSSTSILLMKEKRAKFFEMFVSIRNDKHIPFGEVLFLREAAAGKANKRPKFIKHRALAAGELIRKFHPEKIFIFNDTYLDQFLMYAGKQFSATIYYVEDGATAYSTYKKKIPHWVHLKNRFFYGNVFRQVEIEGTSPNIDYIVAAYPGHVRKELRLKPVLELPKTVEPVFSKLHWPNAFLRALNDPAISHKYDSCYVLGYSGLSKHIKNYASTLTAIVKRTVKKNFLSAVKYHPREQHHDYLSLGPLGLNVIHRSIPAEFVYYANRNHMKYIYGDIGTSLITARWFLPDVKVFSFMDRLKLEDQPFKNLLCDIGVDML
jgi:hypothetical protein